MTTGQKIHKRRKELSLTLDKLAEMSGIAKASLCRIENGVNKGNIGTIGKIAQALGLSLDELVRDGEIEIKRETPASMEKVKAELKDVRDKLLKICAELGIK